MPECGTQSAYGSGCRCRPCRDAHAEVWRERRNRKKEGILADGDRVPAEPAQAALRWLREQGLKWSQIEAISGMERRTLDRVMAPTRVNVARSTQVVLERTVQRVKDDPLLLVRDALRFPATWTLWQVRALMAMGWTEDILEDRAGMTMPRRDNKWVNRNTYDAVESLFSRLHYEWGPSHPTALSMWRKGVLPPDCYEWEERDTRPIPGAFHPDLVAEACTFTEGHRSRAKPTRLMLASLGQWSRPECARTAHKTWCEAFGHPVEDYSEEPLQYAHKWRATSPWCHQVNHRHDVLPEAWR